MGHGRWSDGSERMAVYVNKAENTRTQKSFGIFNHMRGINVCYGADVLEGSSLSNRHRTTDFWR